ANAEVAQVREWIERLALAHPGTGFRLLSHGRTLLSLKPSDEPARVRAVLSDGESHPVISESLEQEGLRVRAHWLQGFSTPQSRRVVQIVNARAVKDRMLQQAALSAFRQA